MEVETIVKRVSRVPASDSAAKVLNHMQKSEKMLKAGHGLDDSVPVQKRLVDAPGPTSLFRCVLSTNAAVVHVKTQAMLVPPHQRFFIGITVCSHPTCSLYALVGRKPLPEPRVALFDVCSENFHHALPSGAIGASLPPELLGELVSEPVPVAAAQVLQGEPEQVKGHTHKKEKKEKKVCLLHCRNLGRCCRDIRSPRWCSSTAPSQVVHAL
jgi:hypothetical protein